MGTITWLAIVILSNCCTLVAGLVWGANLKGEDEAQPEIFPLWDDEL